MIKNIFILIIFITFSKALSFEETQSILKDIRKIVQYEESIARAYENYILEEYKIPSSISDLNLPILSDIENDFNEITLSSENTRISYALKSNLKDSEEDDIERLNALYKSNTYRKRTYVRGDNVYFRFEDDFAKHLYDLLDNTTDKELITCPEVSDTVNGDTYDPAINCTKDYNLADSQSNENIVRYKHIYLGVTKIEEVKDKDGNSTGYSYPSEYLIAYRSDKFKTGPIVITANEDDWKEVEFDTIPNGALLFDTEGIKYVKTTKIFGTYND